MTRVLMLVAVAIFATTPLFAGEKKADKKATTKTACESHKGHEHVHGKDCGHEAVPHDGHSDYKHDGHMHAEHGGHYDEHKTN